MSDKDRVKAMQQIMLLTEFGVMLKEPYSRQVQGKIRELRTSGKVGEIRILYFPHKDKTFVLLNAFVKKTPKTPQKEIETAVKRMQILTDSGD
ncbi:MAG: type II toxin-antitoxin system RelE/ParE family toxin [Nitrospinae bacterium]|nr:type II toxin-antitoxin system RelE/ParE family toxin [Nitrospinota bacterium]